MNPIPVRAYHRTDIDGATFSRPVQRSTAVAISRPRLAASVKQVFYAGQSTRAGSCGRPVQWRGACATIRLGQCSSTICLHIIRNLEIMHD